MTKGTGGGAANWTRAGDVFRDPYDRRLPPVSRTSLARDPLFGLRGPPPRRRNGGSLRFSFGAFTSIPYYRGFGFTPNPGQPGRGPDRAGSLGRPSRLSPVLWYVTERQKVSDPPSPTRTLKPSGARSPDRARRSVLFSPGDRTDQMRNVLSSGADVVVFDLEEAVAPDAEDEAREAAASSASRGRRSTRRWSPGRSASSPGPRRPTPRPTVRVPTDSRHLGRVADPLGPDRRSTGSVGSRPTRPTDA